MHQNNNKLTDIRAELRVGCFDKSKSVCIGTCRERAARLVSRYKVHFKSIGTEAETGGVKSAESFGISEPKPELRNISNLYII